MYLRMEMLCCTLITPTVTDHQQVHPPKFDKLILILKEKDQKVNLTANKLILRWLSNN